MPSAPIAVPSIFITFPVLYKHISPFSRLSRRSLDTSLGCVGALEFHVFHRPVFAFGVFALGLVSTVPCLGSRSCFQFQCLSYGHRSIMTYFFQCFQRQEVFSTTHLLQDAVSAWLCAHLSPESPNQAFFSQVLCLLSLWLILSLFILFFASHILLTEVDT